MQETYSMIQWQPKENNPQYGLSSRSFLHMYPKVDTQTCTKKPKFLNFNYKTLDVDKARKMFVCQTNHNDGNLQTNSAH